MILAVSVGTIYRIVSNIAILASYLSYRYRDNSPPNKTIIRTTLSQSYCPQQFALIAVDDRQLAVIE